ncbi:hypothetical protein [Pelobacter seleniigenes]|uniref:hypothetical protein n=1 Tax=Pelobacter seleniigenes TaxID=407188 RepID=UPI0004A6FEE2|nr:hypothetical protein [Pelobacter seleniigenes]
MTGILRRVILIGILISSFLLASCGENSSKDSAGHTGWGTPATITDGSGNASWPSIVMDSAGNAIVVWRQYDGSVNSLWSNRYDAATSSWGTAELIEANSANTFSFKLAMDSSGNAMAVWLQYDGPTSYSLWANYYDRTALSWGTAVEIEGYNASWSAPKLAMDNDDNALVVWEEYDGFNYSLRVSRYDAATASWGAIEVGGSGVGEVDDLKIATDGAGNAIVLWRQIDGLGNTIWSSRYNAGTLSWGSQDKVATDGGPVWDCQLAVDEAGNAIAVWVHKETTGDLLWVSHFDVTTLSWGGAEEIKSRNNEGVEYPQVAMDDAGNGIVAWRQYTAATDSIKTRYYNAVTSSWERVADIKTSSTELTDFPQIAFNAGGGIAVWEQSDGAVSTLWTNRFNTATLTWGEAEAITNANDEAYFPQIAMDSNGNAIVVWVHSDGAVDNIWVSHSE